jgi:hypothetical protein
MPTFVVETRRAFSVDARRDCGPLKLTLNPDDPATGHLVDAWLVALRGAGVPGPVRQWCAIRLGRAAARGWRARTMGEWLALRAFLRCARRNQD